MALWPDLVPCVVRWPGTQRAAFIGGSAVSADPVTLPMGGGVLTGKGGKRSIPLAGDQAREGPPCGRYRRGGQPLLMGVQLYTSPGLIMLLAHT